MKNLANFISKIDENNFVNIYFVAKKPAQNVVTCESIMFHDINEAKGQCDYMNEKFNTTEYFVFETSMHI